MLALAVVPGLSHLLLGRRSRAVHLLVFALAMALVVVWRWHGFRAALSSPDVGNRIAALFLIVAVGATVAFSLVDARRLYRGATGE